MAPVTEAFRKVWESFAVELQIGTICGVFFRWQGDSGGPDGDVSRIVAGSFCLNIELRFGVRLCRRNSAREWSGGQTTDNRAGISGSVRQGARNCTRVKRH